MIWLLMTRESFLEINTDNYLPGFGDSLTFDLQGKSFVYLLRQNPNIYSYKLTDGVNFLETTAHNFFPGNFSDLNFSLPGKNSVYLLLENMTIDRDELTDKCGWIIHDLVVDG
ncbi:MAG: hypothetical protein F6K23_02825 [Okeania sp. SIO2C9]|uniref:hypothetical protein n=1 Tax=Okeania sp. SIO2C9 TaxID=2607791 RepID=UPI0013C0A67B|nr:hypothetical protein [Okeania sp. SIO2C9]NEQ72102.1 hypothetical protein [Okeania sp. SIO2C9]